jgi:hypothetical protein
MYAPFPPDNNTERYLHAIGEKLDVLIAELKAELQRSREFNEKLAALIHPPNTVESAPVLDFDAVRGNIDKLLKMDVKPDVDDTGKHYLVNRLKCACGFAVNPKGLDKLRVHMEEHNPPPCMTAEL